MSETTNQNEAGVQDSYAVHITNEVTNRIDLLRDKCCESEVVPVFTLAYSVASKNEEYFDLDHTDMHVFVLTKGKVADSSTLAAVEQMIDSLQNYRNHLLASSLGSMLGLTFKKFIESAPQPEDSKDEPAEPAQGCESDARAASATD